MRGDARSDVKTRRRSSTSTLPAQAAVALVVGYDYRVGDDPTDSRSDTLMLIRADPATKTISMLSFPRDLIVAVYCPGGVAGQRPDQLCLLALRLEGHARDGRS